jgi:hypothetical protein
MAGVLFLMRGPKNNRRSFDSLSLRSRSLRMTAGVLGGPECQHPVYSGSME